MNKTTRALCLALLAALLLACMLPAQAEEDVTAFIPNKINRLSLPTSEESFFEKMTYEGDPFETGIEGAVTTLYEGGNVYDYDSAEIGDVKVEIYLYDVMYIKTVRTDYPEGNYIRRIEANYRVDKALDSYLITYQTAEDESYTIRYAPRTQTVAEFHSHTVDAQTGSVTCDGIYFYHDVPTVDGSLKLSDTLFLHSYREDQVLEGRYNKKGLEEVRSGSGKNIKKWYLWDYYSGTVKEYKKGSLKPCTSFPSIRVAE